MEISVQGKSSSSSSTSNSTPPWTFHVFLSFMGEDTRRGFTDHLYAALRRKGIIAFRDDEELERGEVISQKLLKAIEDSLSAIVVLSKNYASSTWCLDELQKILESRNELGREVFPIFYDVDPSDVRYQRGSLAEPLTTHEEKFKENKEKVQRWREALTEVANISGWDSNGCHEAELIENYIVEAIWTKLCSKLPSYNDKLVGIESRISEMHSHLGIGLDDVRFVGIWGMGGIGKTTLARVVYERLHRQFEICCFLLNVREVSERDGHVHLQRQLLSHLNVKSMKIEDMHEGKRIIKSLCCNKKVLLVLDDVSSVNQLENLAESQEWFGSSSRIIITTRDIHLLKSHGVCEIYKVEIMNNDESLQLLSRKAFKTDHPEESYSELSKSIVQYAGGLPLALQVFGSFLCGRSLAEWEDTLDKLEKIPNCDILKKLRISFDGLDDEEKTIFLNIACFFNRWKKDKVTNIFKFCGLHPTIGLSVLIEKSLLVEKSNDFGAKHLEMHDLLQDMGRSIVFRESPNPSKRSRLWSLEEVDQVLEKNKGTEAIQGIVLRLHKPCKAYWDPEAFLNMCNLRLLIVSSSYDLHLSHGLNCHFGISDNFQLFHGLKCLPSALKVLQWTGYPLTSLPLEVPLNKLVDIDMHHSKIKQLWNGVQCLGELKFIDLSHSYYLIETPNFFGVPNLERLILEDCTNLVEIHPSLGQLKKLVVVNLKGCKNLVNLPWKLEMNSLREFILCGCSKVRKLSDFGENMKSLTRLDLEETSLATLPESLGLLTGLEVLNLRGCKNLVCLPCTIHNLKHLKSLDIFGCSKFSELPKNLNEIEALEDLDVSGTAIREVPSSIGHLAKLKTLSFKGCKGSSSNSWILRRPPFNQMFQRLSVPNGLILPPSVFALTSLKNLDLSYCNIGDGSIPHDFGRLTSLETLFLRGNNFVNLPASCISNLFQLKLFDLSHCPRLQSLSDFGENLKNLTRLDLEETSLATLPESLGLLIDLKVLNLRGCKNLVCLPCTIRNLKHLKSLDIFGCSKFSELPKNLNEIEALEDLDVSGTAIREVPSSIGHLAKLKTLSFDGCKGSLSNSWILRRPSFNQMFQRLSVPNGLILPPSVFALTSLKDLDLSYCNIGDGSIPHDFGRLTSLETLLLRGNNFVTLPASCISNLLQLQLVDLSHCPRLQSLPSAPPRLFFLRAEDCVSMEPLSDEQLWYLFSTLDHESSYREKEAFVMAVRGSEIPSWFHNRKFSFLSEDKGVSLIVEIPQYFRASEWSGIALCFVLEVKYEYPDWSFFPFHEWNLQACEDDKYRFIRWGIFPFFANGYYRTLYIIYVPCNEHILCEGNRNQLELLFKTDSDRWGAIKVQKCGWRVICKEDMEEWRKTNDFNKLSP